MKHQKVFDEYKDNAIYGTYSIFKEKKKKPDTAKFDDLQKLINRFYRRGDSFNEITVRYKDKSFKLDYEGLTTIKSILLNILFTYKKQLPDLKYNNFRIYKDKNFLSTFEILFG